MLNDVDVSIWDILSTTEALGKSYATVREQVTRLDAESNIGNQELLEYRPTTTSSESISFTLSKSGPSISYKFEPGSWKTETDSRLSENYGKWILTPKFPTTDLPRLETNLGIRVSNAAGSFLIQHSHTITLSSIYTPNNGTGVRQFWVNDR
ncbi:hypothetical protein [Oceanirhabdus sp. W0125-5]|uniref:hypothetical protein n=1 Tax=Oceanirhabdus sp. W0125-5 TaxID=2999116 RepID=UPI0022F2F09B|nr:hypothetical protein [Oceanirhabdus sp. W0125-5]WBW98187.1 hypothetical protein OW730_05325 [Oceanirhabdus sp. W0125-5]